LGGHASIGQRFAIDWVQVDSKGRTFSGPENLNESYYAYNKNVLACADARVVTVVDGVKSNVPRSGSLAEVITPRTLPGNHIILDLGNGIFAAYAHLIPGSIRVKAGQRVKVGQVIARLGNTGNSSEPHLHFQIMNAPDFIMSEGLPFGHPFLTIQKTEPVPGDEDALRVVGPRLQIRNQMPLNDDWVTFPR
jgi:murein DD-endopeptidase MepM/ murein hydrolase activator NlpD